MQFVVITIINADGGYNRLTLFFIIIKNKVFKLNVIGNMCCIMTSWSLKIQTSSFTHNEVTGGV